MEGLGCLGALVVAFVVLGLIVHGNTKNEEARRKRIADAKAAYEEGLEKLRRDPSSAQLRGTVLDLGRQYSNLSRDQKGRTLFDEVALMNDINAATPGVVTAGSVAATPVSSIEERLARLERLKAQSLVTDDEYTAQRKRILDDA